MSVINQEKANRLKEIIAVATALLGQVIVNSVFRETYGKSLDMWLFHVKNVEDGTYTVDSAATKKVINSYDSLILALKRALIQHIDDL